MNFPDLKQLPAWLLLFALAAIAIIVGASREIIISGNALRIAAPLNYVVIVVGVGFVVIGIFEIRRSIVSNGRPVLPVKSISIDMLQLVEGKGKRARINGKVTPSVSGVRIWILREHLASAPGKFDVGANAALTDKNGEWQQFTNLWGNGKFRIHAMVVDSNSELLFRYYRQAFEVARRIYQRDVDPTASSFPGWPDLDSLPTNCLSSHSEIVI